MAAAMLNADKDFEASEKGTKEYWDSCYTKELENFKDHGDVGEIWFGEDCVRRVVKWIKNSKEISVESSFLDLGCGNGYSLLKLAKLGYSQLTGVDYSPDAILLAKEVAKEEKAEIIFQAGDILESPMTCSCLQQSYSVVLDKGTFDAISLNPQDAGSHCSQYITNVGQLLKKDGLLIITSCNWSNDQLKKHFNLGFTFVTDIPGPTFQFGGMTGNRETTLVFRKS